MDLKNKLSKSGVTLVVSLLLFVNAGIAQSLFKTGIWSGVLQLNDSTELPFDFEMKELRGKYSFDIINGEERIAVDEIYIRGDSVFIKLPVFDSEFRCRRNSSGMMKGVWINYARKDKNVIPFTGSFCDERCREKTIFVAGKYISIDGRYECDFSPESKNSSKAIAIIKQKKPFEYISGTFLTETGDYRYLSGRVVDNNTFSLSCFDGAHAFLFTGKIKGDSIVNGHFYSGAHWQEPWVGVRNDTFELRNPDSLTYLKPGFTKIDFSFKDLEGKDVSLSDEKFKNKVVIIQLMGTWCPNCMDETKFLAPFYDTYNKQGLEVVALAFERTNDFAKAVSNIKRTKERLDADYEFLITMKTGKDQASEALPMLNGIMAFPTTIFIDKKGIVRKIYTGFNGPATGDAYTRYAEETRSFVEKLLKE